MVPADTTPPTITATPDRAPNGATWYNADVKYTFTCTDNDGGSGVNTCPAEKTVSTEGKDQSFTVEATDKAGNKGSLTVSSINIDKTKPIITAGAPTGQAGENGWYLGDVSVTFTCADNLSGVVACPRAKTTTGEGTGLAINSGVVKDLAGNEAASVSGGTYNVDKTNPTITGAADRDPNAAGWYNAAVKVTFTCGDAISGVASCTPEKTLDEGANQSVTGTVTDKAGRTTPVPATVSGINIDTTKPTLTFTRTAANGAGWNNSDVTVTFGCDDNLSAVASCAGSTVVTKEGADQTVTGTATDKAGNQASLKVENINIDKTAPVIKGSRTPGANSYGWNNGDVTVSFACSDALSGSASCTAPIILSDEGAGQSATGTVTDKAGNSATDKVENINIDRTAPTIALSTRTAANAAGWNKTDVTATFACDGGISGMVSCEPVTVSTEGKDQSVTRTVQDKAGNSASLKVSDINIDKTAPTFSGSLETPLFAENIGGTALKLGTLTANESGSGLNGGMTCTHTKLLIGTTTVTCSAKDNADNSATDHTQDVTVTFKNTYSGTYNLLAPLKNTPGDLSLVKLGATVPVKFTAPNYASGSPATDLAPGLILKVAFRNVTTGDGSFEVTDTNSAGSTAWRYDATTNQYIYNLSTKTDFTAGEYELTISYKGIVVARGGFNVKK